MIGVRFLSVSARTKDGLGEEDMLGILKWVILADTEAQAGADRNKGKGRKRKSRKRKGRKKMRDQWSFHDMRERLKRLVSQGRTSRTGSVIDTRNPVSGNSGNSGKSRNSRRGQ